MSEDVPKIPPVVPADKPFTQAEADKMVADAIAKDRADRKKDLDKVLDKREHKKKHFEAFNKNTFYGICAVILCIGVAMGKISIADALAWVTGVSKTSSTTVTETKSGPNPPKIESPVVKLPESDSPKPAEPTKADAEKPRAELSDEDRKRITDLIKFVTDFIAQQNKPKPPVVVPPDTNPPHIDPPAPTPKPSDTLKLTLTDASGLPVASSSVLAGKLILIKLEGFKGPKIEWTKRPTGDVQFADTGNQGAAVVLGPGSELDLFVTDYGVQSQVSLRIVANQGSQPPPTPIDPPIVVTPPNPVNPPSNIPPGSKKYTLCIVEDPSVVRSLETAKVMNNLSARKTLTDKGHSVTVTVPVTANDPAAVFVKQQGTALPALAIMDSQTRQFVKAVPLPADFGVSVLSGIGG